MAQSVYSPLDPLAQTVRLINIQPGEDFPIACTFHTYELTTCPPFVALSYTWGPSTPVSEITMDGTTLPIRKNLWFALCSIRARPSDSADITTSLLWIDAISIDQSNVQERNHQVKMMKEIYSQAAFVFTWLGPSTALNALAFQTIQHVIASAHDQPLQLLLGSQAQSALLALFRNPYWTRLWIVQEILLAKDVVIMCGDTLCQWTALTEFFRHIRAISLSSRDDTVHASLDPMLTSPANHIVANRDIWLSQEVRSYKLAELLVMWPGQECEDPRDRVFGLLGLLSQQPGMVFSADYSMTTIEVFRHVLTHVDNAGFQETENSRSGFADNLRNLLKLQITNDAVNTMLTAFEMKGSFQKAVATRGAISGRQWEASMVNYFRK